ncbi:YicC/YloC family endoribonuclease [Kordiimonas marina]|uniref:YicC/YloC family endoribonuclease n=1 Tax=Kordiimonas marina TaxID=2872312 RepID=UPI001FF4383C|nr:YicC/YloC family endoribonuclease [Kordiimonas marina]MCJ9428940.1 YicC family protein [Kordiimonas marina]
MALMSMTGFARAAGEGAGCRWNWEIKSVNNKGLEVRTKLPGLIDGFDLTIKKRAADYLTRGSVFVTLSVSIDGDEGALVINEERLEALLALAAKYTHRPGVEPARLDGLLAVKGVVDVTTREMDEDEKAALEADLSKSFDELLDALKSARAQEGARLQTVLEGQLADIERLAKAARAAAGDRLEGMQARFSQQLAKLAKNDKPVSEERLAQEVALMAVKADVQEELDRLDSHVEEARRLLAEDKPVGRRLDFLCQEFNREANTLCSKSGDNVLTKIGLDLKVLIDQFREQIQNIE